MRHVKNDLYKLETFSVWQVQHVGTMYILIYWKNKNNLQTLKTKVVKIEIQVKTPIWILGENPVSLMKLIIEREATFENNSDK